MKSDINFYYSVLYCNEITRQKILSLRTLNENIKNIPFKPPEIIQSQFDFWQNELEEKNPSHPLIKSIHHLFPFKLILDDLNILLSHYQKDAGTHLYEKSSDLDKYFQDTGGFFEKCIYQHIYPEKNHATDSIEKLGILIAKAESFFQLRQQILKGKIYISGENLLQYKTTLYELSQLSNQSHIQDLLKNEIENILSLMPNDIEPCYTPSLVLAKIYIARLQVIEKNLNQFFTHQMDITPLKKFWIAWRLKSKNQI